MLTPAEMAMDYAVFSQVLGLVELALIAGAFLLFVKIVRGKGR